MKPKVSMISSQGFALPTVMIASVVMLMVLLSGLVSASSVSTVIREQFNERLIKQAQQSGATMVDACLEASFNSVTWTNAKPLKPNTDCSGNLIGGVSEFLVDTPTLKTSFEVPYLTVINSNQIANVQAKMLLYRTSSPSTAYRQTDRAINAIIRGQTSFSNVTFGYRGGATPDSGAQFAVVLATGEVKTAGKNNNGRLGHGTASDTADPLNFILPINERGIAAFSNFLSVGRQISVLTANGKVYSAGSNEFGQLGNSASTASPVSTPVQFGAIGNSGQPKAKFVAMSDTNTYVIADNNRVYASGACTSSGMLGNGCTSGNATTPVQVSLPTPTADLNTQPEPINDWVQSTNLTNDRLNTFVRMKGGHVYGWGINDYGQLGDFSFTTRTTPIRIQALSSSSTPLFKQVAWGGDALYLLDVNGRVWASGRGGMGSLAGTGANVRNAGAAQCMAKESTTNKLIHQACATGSGLQLMEFWPDGTWRFRPDSATVTPQTASLCATPSGGVGAEAGNEIILIACDGRASQQWQFRGDKTIYSPSLNACAIPFGSLFPLACDASSTYHQWTVQNSPNLRPMPIPAGFPKATRISNDNTGVVILYENGDVWAAGSNNRNQLGIGTAYLGTYNPVLRQVPLPGPAADIYTTEHDPVGPSTGINLAAHNNSFFVLRDGSVYGAGADNYGQLGRGGTLTANYLATPAKMLLPAGVLAKSVQSAYGSTVILTTKGKVFTVGNNSNGQLGDGTFTSSSIPSANKYTNRETTIIY